MRRGFAALSSQACGSGWQGGRGWRKGRHSCATPCFHGVSALGRSADRGVHPDQEQESCQRKPLFRSKPPTRPARICEHPRKSMGGRGAMPDATPSLLTNARQSMPIRLFAGVCRCGIHFGPGPRSLAPRQSTLINVETPINQGVAQERLSFRHPPPRRHPCSSALTALCKRPLTLTVTGLRNRETPMPHLGSMPDPKDKPRTLLVGWISRLDLALELGLSVDTLRRWEAQRCGPPCVRAGRKVFYRRAAVEEWLEEQEQAAPRRRRSGGRR